MQLLRAFSLALFVTSAVIAQVPAKRSFRLDDLNRIQDVREAEVSPDGKWIAYTLSSIDKEGDKRDSNIWMVSWDGHEDIQMTFTAESDSLPRWSPDGRYLSFLSSRPGKAKGDQIWVIDRRGGEARQLTEVKEKISEYAWSPDSKKLLLLMREPDEPVADPAKPANAPPPPPKPIVLDRYHFKQDEEGYRSGTKFTRIYLYDIATKTADRLTNFQKSDESDPAWSPDGDKIAFVSNQDEDPDRSENSDVWVAGARPHSQPRQLTTYKGFDGERPAWSPDSKLIAFVEGTDPKYSAYSQHRLAVVPSDGSQSVRLIHEKLDRGVSSPIFSENGKSIVALVNDDRSEYPARFALNGESVERLIATHLAVREHSQAGGHAALIASSDFAFPEVFAMEGGKLRKLTSHNDGLLTELQWGQVDEVSFHSKDGTEVHGILILPVGYEKGKKYPTLLRIHGGPNGQDDHSLALERQWFAANGYAVLAVNYRGSSGRGREYTESIFADWGNKEVADLLAGVDQVIAMGVADPDRLGIGGWSYGGILTDYTIASDQRFKAAISGAGSANQISMYGTDQYVFQYDTELGPPWKNPEGWVKISYPFFHADRIHTPTLFLGGDLDFNVPLVGGEQMYQALKTLGVPTELVIYPGQHHAIVRPSFQRDRLERYLAWYDKYLKAPAVPAPVKTASAN